MPILVLDLIATWDVKYVTNMEAKKLMENPSRPAAGAKLSMTALKIVRPVSPSVTDGLCDECV